MRAAVALIAVLVVGLAVSLFKLHRAQEDLKAAGLLSDAMNASHNKHTAENARRRSGRRQVMPPASSSENTGQSLGDAILLALARAAADKAIAARGEAEQRVRALEGQVRRLQPDYDKRTSKLARADRLLKENDRLKREAFRREQHVIFLESRLARTKVYRPVGR